MTDNTSQPEKHEFQAEVSRLLHLMVHSVYSDKEVFLRELISNASDACDKLRYLSLTQPELVDGDANFRIEITVDSNAKTIRIADNGIGMNRQDLIDHLGTIARSGTGQFFEQLTGDAAKDSQLIGQFGVGFYSAFMVADTVDVISRKAGEDAAWHWHSDGSGAYEIAEAVNTDGLIDDRGTAVTLHVPDDSAEYLSADRLRVIIKTYSDHIALPIMVRDASAEEDQAAEPVNSAGALWTRPKSDITDEQYKEFYHHVAHQFDDPWLRVHYKAEGRHEYTVLLFVPSTRPLDLFDPKRSVRMKLYVKRVFITDDAPLLPGYLRFVRGIVDSQDMPLNISREMLQNNPLLGNIRKALTKRVLSELAKKADKEGDAYNEFWEAFGPALKEGIYEDPERRGELLSLARFKTTKGDGFRSLKDYLIDRHEKQSAIYFIQGDDEEMLARSPQLEGFKARGLEVLLLTHPVDAFWTSAVQDYEGTPFRPVAEAAADLDVVPKPDSETVGDEDAAEPVNDAAIGTLIALFKQALDGLVTDVRRSERLTTSAVCLVAPEGTMDPYLQRILAQSRTDGGGPEDSLKARVLEINPSHAVIRQLAEKVQAAGVKPELEDAAHLLLDQARIAEGEAVVDATAYAKRLSDVLLRGLDGA